jgi:hypothetical protein
VRYYKSTDISFVREYLVNFGLGHDRYLFTANIHGARLIVPLWNCRDEGIRSFDRCSVRQWDVLKSRLCGFFRFLLFGFLSPGGSSPCGFGDGAVCVSFGFSDLKYSMRPGIARVAKMTSTPPITVAVFPSTLKLFHHATMLFHSSMIRAL